MFGKKNTIKASVRRREARYSGEGYSTAKGKYVLKKTFKYISCNCNFQCMHVPSSERELIFKKFWNTKNWQCQENIISNSVKIHEPKRKSLEKGKSQSRVFC